MIICGAQAVAAALFAFTPSGAGLFISAVIFGLTSLSVPGIVGAACADFFGAELASASLGLATLFIGIGMVAGPLVGGALRDASSSFVQAYALAAGFFIVGAVVALFMTERRRSEACAPRIRYVPRVSTRRSRRAQKSATAA